MYDNTNRGSIWPNQKKETENHPDFTGSLDVDGKEYWVSAWKRKPGAKENSPSLTFSIREKDAHIKAGQQAIGGKRDSGLQTGNAHQAQSVPQAPPVPQSGGFDNNFDDDIPF